MKHPWLKHLIAIIICGILASLAETFIFNFPIITQSDDNAKVFEVPYSTQSEDDKTNITLEQDQHFINKLIINYQAQQDVKYSLSYTHPDAYNDTSVQSTSSDIFDDSFSSSITNIGSDASDITITYASTDDLDIDTIVVDNEFHFNYFRAIFIFLILLIIYSLYIFYKQGFKTEKLHIYFAVIGTLLGLTLIAAQPTATFTSWDDQIHFGVVTDWPGGNINYSNGEYQLSDYSVANSAGKDSVNSADEKSQQINYLNSDIDNEHTKNAFFFPRFDKLHYLPMAIGYNLAKVVHLPFVICFLMGKILNLLVYVALLSYAIKISKIGKRLIAFVALIPVNIFLAGNYSYDPAVFAGITILFVHTINLLLDKSAKLDFKTASIMIISAVYASLAKAIYAPFLLLVWLIPRSHFKSTKQCRLAKIAFSVLMIVLLALPLFNGGTASDPRGGHTSVGEQASLILEQPTGYATVLNHTAGTQLLPSLIGSNSTINFAYLGDASNLPNLYLLLLIFLIFFFITDNQGNLLKKAHRFTILAIVTAIIVLIWTSLYLSFNPVGSSHIVGVQGRYFLPLLIPLLFSLQPSSIQNKISPKIYNLLALLIPAIIFITAVYATVLLPYSF